MAEPRTYVYAWRVLYRERYKICGARHTAVQLLCQSNRQVDSCDMRLRG
jgi:hypothetical protein